MRIKDIITISIFIICIITISIFTSGGCPIEFGGGGGGDGGNLQSIVQGTITNTPNDDVSGITVVLSNNGNLPFFPSVPTVTNSSGDFFIEGNFDGCLTLRLEFQDSNNEVIAFTNVTVFPNANINLGGVTLSLENGNVILQDDINLTFQGKINFTPPTLTTCSGGVNNSVGTIVITKSNTDITVQINSTTRILDKNSNPIGCDNLIANQNVQVIGTLQVNDIVLANQINLTAQTPNPTPTPTPTPM